MPKSITDVETLQAYIAGVQNRAGHHALQVDEIVLTLIGAILWRMDPGTLQVREQDGEMKNVLWVSIGGTKYAFSYKHAQHRSCIEMRCRGTQGDPIRQFRNSNSLSGIQAFFRKL